MIVAKMVKQLLDEWKIKGFPKVSGATGVHICTHRSCMTTKSQRLLCSSQQPIQGISEKVTLSEKSKTGIHVYIDFPQNAQN